METNERGDGLDQRAALETRVREVLATQAAVDALREEHLTFGERAADRLAAVAGSWTFIFTFLGVLALWIGLNAFAWTNRWTPTPSSSSTCSFRSSPRAGAGDHDEPEPRPSTRPPA